MKHLYRPISAFK